MKNRGFGHLKTKLFTIKTSKHVGLGGPWYIYKAVLYSNDIYTVAWEKPDQVRFSCEVFFVGNSSNATRQNMLQCASHIDNFIRRNFGMCGL